MGKFAARYRPLAAAVALAVAFGAGAISPVRAAEFPLNKPVRIFVGVTAGGATDVVARLIGRGLNDRLGRTVVIENRPGGNFAPAANAVKSAEPDGHTLLIMSTSYAMTQGLRPDLPYNLVGDFKPVSLIGTGPLILVAAKHLPVRDFAEFLSLARSQPGKLRYASAGAGTVTHLPAVLLLRLAGIEMVHVPYRGGGPALNDLLGGHVDVMFDPATTLIPQILSASVTPLGVTGPKRMAEVPNVPTLVEAGLPGFDVQSWYGVMAPLGTPPDIVDKLQNELAEVLKSPAVKERLATLGTEPVGASPEEFGRHLRAEIDRWSKLIKEAGITAE